MGAELKTRVYLGDLAHYTIKLTNNHTPINIGFIAAYLKRFLNEQVEMRLFKNPDILLEAIKQNPPDILALSNYVWCQSISELCLEFYKSVKPDGITVWGGPNFPMNERPKARAYIQARPYLDFYIPFEGETPMLNIAKAFQEHGPKLLRIKSQIEDRLEGAFFLSDSGELLGKNIGIQLKDINEVPSPYLEGWMDPFLKEGIYPMFETQRGCPFHCGFCHTGLDYYNKGRSFSLERCKEEILYITKTVPDPTKAHLYITDSNFGMWPQDLDFTRWLKAHYEHTGFPLSFGTSTGKARIDLVLQTVKTHPKLMLNNAVQSMDDTVLKEIRRKNFSVAQLSHSQREIDEDGKLSTPEVILGLPFETRESHLNTLRSLVNDIGASLMFQYTLMLLPGTTLYTDESREKYKYNVKYRLLPTSFGEYAGKKCFEIEEVASGHKDLSYADYLEMREVFFFWHNINSNAIYRTLVRYLHYLGDDVIDFFFYLMKQRRVMSAEDFPNRVVQDFIRDTEEELFDSREDLIRHFSEEQHYEDLNSGRKGKNLTHTYRAHVLLHAREWAEYVTRGFKDYLFQKHPDAAETLKIVDAVSTHILTLAECQYRYFCKRSEIPTQRSPLKTKLEYDIPSIFVSNLAGADRPELKPERVVYAYYLRDDAIQYIASFPENQRLVDLQLMVLRMDQNYLLPVFRREEDLTADSAFRSSDRSDFSSLKHNP